MRIPGLSSIRKLFRRLRFQHRLLLVTDRSSWILDDVATQLDRNLPDEFRTLILEHEWQEARNSLVHFINRDWAWDDRILENAHPSNKLIGLWWHGRLDSPEENMQASLARARRVHHRFARMQVTCSSGLETMLAIGVPEERLVVLPEGVDLQRFHPPSMAQRQEMRAQLAIPDDAFVIGCFQKDGEGWEDGNKPKLIKGPDVLAEVLIQVHNKHNIVALIPGPARGYLKQRLKDAGVPFIAPGFVPNEELPKYHYALDTYISPSRDEGGPAGFLEAMGSKVPVVSTKAGMPTDMIMNRENGFLADIEDVDSLASNIGTLIEQPQLRDTIVQNAFETIQAYDWRLLTPLYVEKLYTPLWK